MEEKSTYDLIMGGSNSNNESPAEEKVLSAEIDTEETDTEDNGECVAAENNIVPDEQNPGCEENAAETGNVTETPEAAEPEPAESEAAEQEAVGTENPAPDVALLMAEMQQLKHLFDKKLLIDEKKNAIIEALGAENKQYKEGLYGKIFKPLLMDVIEIADDLHRMIRAYQEKPDETIDKKKFLSVLSIYESDLEDILGKYDVDVYEVDGDEFDAKRQKIIKIVETDDESLNRKVSQRAMKGFELDGKILSPERVYVYKYVPKVDDGDADTKEE